VYQLKQKQKKNKKELKKDIEDMGNDDFEAMDPEEDHVMDEPETDPVHLDEPLTQ
jgi:hypothetical protein